MHTKEITKQSVVSRLVADLSKAIAKLPADFYDSFDYTTTGKNLTHPLTLGILTKILGALDHVTHVGVDVRFNAGKDVKFQPDLVAYEGLTNPTLFVDYESPNSSDARVPEKDVEPYSKWLKAPRKEPGAPVTEPEYVIVTTLPTRPSPRWQVRYTSRGGYNHEFRNQRKQIRDGPFDFWYRYYRKRLRGEHLRHLRFINIDGKQVRHVPDIGA